MSAEQPGCPLITDYTNEIQVSPQLLERLYVVRKWDIRDGNPIPFKWPSLLRTKVFNISTEREDEPLVLRQYQLQVIHHLVRMPRFMVGDAVGLRKTSDAIAAACWLKDRKLDVKVVVLTTRSTTWQWFDEVRRFSLLRPFVMVDKYRGMKSSEARYRQLRDFLEGTKKDVLICKYSSMTGTRKLVEGKFDEDGNPVKNKRERVSQEIRTFAEIMREHGHRVILVTDEAHRFKTPGSQTRKLVVNLARPCFRVWELTGTAMKNSLDEFYAAISAMGVSPFGSMWEFGEDFCIFRKQYIGRGRHKMLLVGYKNIDRFKKGIRPFYLGRSQAQVKEPLPRLLTTYHPIDLDDRQARLLLEDIPSGKFILPPTIVKLNGEIFEQERDPDNRMTMLSVQQLIANHPGLLDRNDEKEFLSPRLSPKEEALLDLLDGDLKGEKVIVFTKFLRHIDRLDCLTKEGKFTDRKFLRITGNENEKQRNTAKRLFQESSDHDLIFINAAGIEGLNLQQAAHMVCLDLPWSWGDLIQLVGRMVRSASPHSLCTLHILVSKGTVDEYTIDILKGKKGVFEAILGESHSAGLLGGGDDIDLDSGMECGSDDEFRLALLKKAHVRAISMKKFLEGDRIEMARLGGQYRMIFEKNEPKGGNKRLEPTEDELAKVWESELY